METPDNFKNAPIHDKKAILELLDELEPKDMIEVVDLLMSKTSDTSEQDANSHHLPDVGKMILNTEANALTIEDAGGVEAMIQITEIYERHMGSDTEFGHKENVLHAINEALRTRKIEKCYNCHEMVQMISTGEVCPSCYC